MKQLKHEHARAHHIDMIESGQWHHVCFCPVSLLKLTSDVHWMGQGHI